jgi:hypothetical protein
MLNILLYENREKRAGPEASGTDRRRRNRTGAIPSPEARYERLRLSVASPEARCTGEVVPPKPGMRRGQFPWGPVSRESRFRQQFLVSKPHVEVMEAGAFKIHSLVGLPPASNSSLHIGKPECQPETYDFCRAPVSIEASEPSGRSSPADPSCPAPPRK